MVVFLCWCGGVFVVVLWPENSYFFSLCQHPARELVLVAVLQDCGGVFGVFVVVFFPKQCGNTWGSYGSGKKPGWLDRGGGRVAHRFHRYFRGFVLACSFRL